MVTPRDPIGITSFRVSIVPPGSLTLIFPGYDNGYENIRQIKYCQSGQKSSCSGHSHEAKGERSL